MNFNLIYNYNTEKAWCQAFIFLPDDKPKYSDERGTAKETYY